MDSFTSEGLQLFFYEVYYDAQVPLCGVSCEECVSQACVVPPLALCHDRLAPIYASVKRYQITPSAAPRSSRYE